MSVSELKTQIRIQKLVCKSCRTLIRTFTNAFLHFQKLRRKDAEVDRLQAALRLFLNKNESQESIVDQEQDGPTHSSTENMDVEVDAEMGDQEGSDEEQDEDDEPLKPIFAEGLYFCPDCIAEIDEGFCMFCKQEYEWKEVIRFQYTRIVLKLMIYY